MKYNEDYLIPDIPTLYSPYDMTENTGPGYIPEQQYAMEEKLGEMARRGISSAEYDFDLELQNNMLRGNATVVPWGLASKTTLDYLDPHMPPNVLIPRPERRAESSVWPKYDRNMVENFLNKARQDPKYISGVGEVPWPNDERAEIEYRWKNEGRELRPPQPAPEQDDRQSWQDTWTQENDAVLDWLKEQGALPLYWQPEYRNLPEWNANYEVWKQLPNGQMYADAIKSSDPRALDSRFSPFESVRNPFPETYNYDQPMWLSWQTDKERRQEFLNNLASEVPYTSEAMSKAQQAIVEEGNIGRGIGGGGFWSSAVNTGGESAETAIHELAHGIHLDILRKENPNFDHDFIKSVVWLANNPDREHPRISYLAHEYVYGNKDKYGPGGWPGMVAQVGNDPTTLATEMFAGLASGSMGDINEFPIWMRKYYDRMFEGRDYPVMPRPFPTTRPVGTYIGGW